MTDTHNNDSHVGLLDVEERALVFTQFREMGDLLQIHVRDRFGLDAKFLHGGVEAFTGWRLDSEHLRYAQLGFNLAVDF